ncbi:integrase core domain-containing protein [Falsigemmobacter intermedius]|uniref:integrase core domain-containing protein n=1 Tax=Falsigemmobacter intermedius TaxID=1553448 RepID=UPI003F11064D
MIADPGTGGIDGIIPDNGMVERVIRTLKEQCIHRHRFDSIRHAARVIGDWIGFDNNRRPHQALAMRTPAEAFKLAA